jgi:CPA1 family monovalent cation:H+ antiporter
VTDLVALLGFLLLALGIAAVLARTRVPYTLGLVLLGLGMGALATVVPYGGLAPSARALLSPTLFFDLLLPPIVFEAAIHVELGFLRARIALVLFLVLVGVVFTTLFTGYVVGALTALPLVAAVLLAAILSPTDPVAVVALFRRLRVPPELATLVESESLLNDAVGVIVVVVLLGTLTGGPVAPAAIALRFLWLVVGGIAVGLAAAALVQLAHRYLLHTPALVALSVAAAYGSFLGAALIGASGILAAVLAGLAVGHWVVPKRPVSELRSTLTSFWSAVVFLDNAVIFLALGLLFGLANLLPVLPLILLVFAVLMAGRALFAYAHRPLARRLEGPGAVLPDAWYRLLTVAGVRGALPVVLVLSFATTTTRLSSGTTSTIETTVLGVVLLSLVVNNLATELLALRTFPEAPPVLPEEVPAVGVTPR